MSAWAVVCVAGAAALACGTLVPLLKGGWRTALLAQAVGMAGVAVAGAAVLFGGLAIGAPFRSDYAPALGIDRLSGFFLVVLALIAVPAMVYARDALRDTPRATPIAALSGAFCLALVGLVAARDVTTFLAFWELMTLLPASMILVVRHDEQARRDVFAYLGITHLGGIGVWVACSCWPITAHSAALHFIRPACAPSWRSPRWSASAPRRARCRCTHGCRGRTRWRRRMSRRSCPG